MCQHSTVEMHIHTFELLSKYLFSLMCLSRLFVVCSKLVRSTGNVSYILVVLFVYIIKYCCTICLYNKADPYNTQYLRLGGCVL